MPTEAGTTNGTGHLRPSVEGRQQQMSVLQGTGKVHRIQTISLSSSAIPSSGRWEKNIWQDDDLSVTGVVCIISFCLCMMNIVTIPSLPFFTSNPPTVTVVEVTRINE
jgi:hypothetical protein